MSETEIEIEVTEDAPTERQTLVREFPVEMQADGDGRTIDLRIVPYNTPATVADPPGYEPYQEEWMPGAFERQMRAADRVKIWLNFEHEQGLRGIVGHGIALRDTIDGAHGSFRVHPTPDGDKALELVNQGVLSGASLEFVSLRSRTLNGVVQRLRAHIDKVSLCMAGKSAYPEAQVLAVRTEPVTIEPLVVNTELNSRLAAIGVAPLTRIKITSGGWDGDLARFTDEQYVDACLIDRGGETPSKQRCSLPVLEPDGTLNTNAMGAAAAVLAGTRARLSGVSNDLKVAAARKLIRYYRLADVEPPASLVVLARG